MTAGVVVVVTNADAAAIVVVCRHPPADVEPLSVIRRPLGPPRRRTDVSMSLTLLLLLLSNVMLAAVPTTRANKGKCNVRAFVSPGTNTSYTFDQCYA